MKAEIFESNLTILRQTISIIVLALIPFISFGHIAFNLNWISGFLFYSLFYTGLGIFQRKVHIKEAFYHIIALIPLFVYPLFVYTENNFSYYPTATPFTIISGGTGYFAGYLLNKRKGLSIVLFLGVIVVDIFWSLNILPKP